MISIDWTNEPENVPNVELLMKLSKIHLIDFQDFMETSLSSRTPEALKCRSTEFHISYLSISNEKLIANNLLWKFNATGLS